MADAKIVLGSASPRRQELFVHLFKNYTLASSPDELADSSLDSPRDFACKNALYKAHQIQEILNASTDIGGAIFTFDTVVEQSGATLGKPQNQEHARSMLRSLSATSHEVHTAYAVVSLQGQEILKGVETTRVWFQALDPKLIDFYILKFFIYI